MKESLNTKTPHSLLNKHISFCVGDSQPTRIIIQTIYRIQQNVPQKYGLLIIYKLQAPLNIIREEQLSNIIIMHARNILDKEFLSN